jgi:hypothetical protein
VQPRTHWVLYRVQCTQCGDGPTWHRSGCVGVAQDPPAHASHFNNPMLAVEALDVPVLGFVFNRGWRFAMGSRQALRECWSQDSCEPERLHGFEAVALRVPVEYCWRVPRTDGWPEWLFAPEAATVLDRVPASELLGSTPAAHTSVLCVQDQFTCV